MEAAMANHTGINWSLRSPEARVFGRADTSSGPDGCWPFLGGRNADGYGKVRYQGRDMGAHRVAYLLAIGPIADGLMVDHMCHTRACVNPRHLRLTTCKQNAEHRATETSRGFRGVRRNSRGKWRASVGHNGTVIHLGTFDNPEQAAEVVRVKRLELHTHNDHDRA